ncbi:uncharacterized protein CEXT_220251 [Caerostris extrusa]|uniref:Uncharacterized protein n=1 Tax=Caerostris extrusa TaxID=172846 RepID=A0AAV4Y4B9_CAEEX|nr:uncharacterized protein CEXT_220251 [Caerostris extrusa]
MLERLLILEHLARFYLGRYLYTRMAFNFQSINCWTGWLLTFGISVVYRSGFFNILYLIDPKIAVTKQIKRSNLIPIESSIHIGSTCKQYGHACLGGHGKRAENPNPHLMDYILRKIAQRSDENPDIASTRSDDLRSIFERSYKKKLDDWDNYSEDDWRSNIFNGMN